MRVQLPETPFTAVILAAQRAGHVDPLAEAAGISHKALVPIAGAPLIVHVAEALLVTPGLTRLRVVVEPEMFASIATALDHPWQLDFVPAADNLADSVIAATDGVDEGMVVTTADNVMLTPGAVVQMLDVLECGADAAIAMATKASVMAAHPSGQRRFYKFTDDEYSNCNLYAFANRKALAAAESFRSGGQFAKKPRRLIAAIGVINVGLFLMHRLSLRGALTRLSRRFKLRIEPVVLEDGAHAIDVDNERTYRVAEILLEQRVRLQQATVHSPADLGLRAAG
jgi:CTP:molybdopterin cytidylyltransferase MocA